MPLVGTQGSGHVSTTQKFRNSSGKGVSRGSYNPPAKVSRPLRTRARNVYVGVNVRIVSFHARAALLISALFLFPAESPAQQLSLSGTVRDTSGVVPGATVVLSSGGNQVSTATTDEMGVYRFNGLTAGSYELSVR